MNRSQRLPRGYWVPPPAFQSPQDKVTSRWIVKEQSVDSRTGVSSTSEAVVSFSSKEIVTSNSGYGRGLMDSNELIPAHESQRKACIRMSGYGRDCISAYSCSTAKMGGGYPTSSSSTRPFVDSGSHWPRKYPNYEKKVSDTEDYRLQNFRSALINEEGSGRGFALRSGAWRSGFSYDKRSNTPLKFEKQQMPRKHSSHILPDLDPEPLSCPICMELLDETDSSFSSCSCGFKLCLFCHHTIATKDGRCPGCRKSYEQKVDKSSSDPTIEERSEPSPSEEH